MPRLLRTFLLVLLLLPGAGPVRAQPEDLTPLTASEIQARLDALGDDPAVAEPADERVRALRAAKVAAHAAEESRLKAADFAAKSSAAPEELRQIQEELAKPLEAFTPPIPQGATLADVERALAQADADAKAARTELDNINAEIPRRNDRVKQIPDEIAALTTQIESLRQQLAVVPAPEVSPELHEAKRIQAAAQLGAAKAKVAELQAEMASYDGRRELLPARRDRAARRVAAAEGRLKAWQDLVNAQRQREAASAAQKAREADLAKARAIPALRDVAADIDQLKEELTGPNSAPRRLAEATTDLADKQGVLRGLQARQQAVRRRIAAGQLDSSQGQFLRRELTKLDDVRVLERRLARYHGQYDRVQLRLIELDELETLASDVERALAEVKEALGVGAREEEFRLATELLGQRKTLVRQALETYQPYSDTLDQLIVAYDTYIELTRAMRSFIEERIFWVRSVSGPLLPSPQAFADDLEWLLDRDAWASVAANGSAMVFPALATGVTPGAPRRVSAAQAMLMPALSGALLLAATGLRWTLGRRSKRPLGKDGRVSDSTMAGTLWKLWLAVAAALPQPLALWIIASWLAGAAEPLSGMDSVVAPIATAMGLNRAAFALFGLGLMREISQQGAVGAAHFRWAEAGLAHLRRQLRWFIPIALLSAMIVAGFAARGDERGADATGRWLFVATMIALAIFYARTLSPKRPLIAEYLKKHRGSLIERTSRVWFPLMVALPIAFALATIAGYAYTALQIQRRCGDTILFILIVIIGNALVLRWLQLARRKLAIEAAKARAAAAAAQAGQGAQAADIPREPEPGSEIDIGSISLQSRKVLQALVTVVLIVGLFAVWSDVLPALKWFERVQIFPDLKYIDPDAGTETVIAQLPLAAAQASQEGAQPAPSPDGGLLSAPAPGGTGASEQAAPPARVTLADLGLALLLLMLTVSASKNVPGLLEITVLQRLPLDAAGRYAYYTVARYLIIIVGVIAVASTLSVSWKSAQWLAAALTFGLAFGLQEIFANFVSGLIILFEQPVRVGDTVTVGGVSGTVSRIRMRATTITDWDNKELVIPNKTFITDQVVNWTLTNPSSRVIVPVGVAYGSDVDLANSLLLRVARESEFVMSKPEPRALFLGFGDSCLNLELRVFIETVDNMLACKHDLHMRIDRAFREAGVEISFPQRDLHVRSVDERVLDELAGRKTNPATEDAGGH